MSSYPISKRSVSIQIIRRSLTQTSAFTAAVTAFKRQHWLVQSSMLTAVLTNLFQPLAGSILEVKNIPFNHGKPLKNIEYFLVILISYYTIATTVTGLTTLGIPPDIATLNAFDAAEGVRCTYISSLQV